MALGGTTPKHRPRQRGMPELQSVPSGQHAIWTLHDILPIPSRGTAGRLHARPALPTANAVSTLREHASCAQHFAGLHVRHLDKVTVHVAAAALSQAWRRMRRSMTGRQTRLQVCLVHHPGSVAIPLDLCSLVLLRCLESLPGDLNHGAETYVMFCFLGSLGSALDPY